MWERFSYYGMRAILVLYMVAPVNEGGLGFSMNVAAQIYGTYTMLIYLSSIPGGLIADKFLGYRLAVFIGGAIIACGHFTMAIPSVQAFYTGLGLIIIGTGLLKPNISTMVGTLYPINDNRRDSGFSIFYMGVNIGGALAPIACGFLAQSAEFKSFLASCHIDPFTCWHWGFAAAGVGMIFGLTQYVLGRDRLKAVGAKPHRKTATETADQQSGPLTADEWKRIGAIAILFFFSLVFWAIYEQGGSSLNVFATKLTDTNLFGWHFPSSWLQSFQAIFVIILAPIFSVIWINLGKREPSSPAKFAYGLLFLCLGIGLMVPASMLARQGLVSPLWLIGVYLLEVVGELCLSPVGLSTVTKLAPVRFLGLTMGLWYVSLALGNRCAGFLAGTFNPNDPMAMVALFGGMSAAAIISAGILALLTPTVRKLMVGVH